MRKRCDMKKQWKQVAFLKKRGEKMPRKKLPKQYGISEFRFRELYYYTLQYPEWEREFLAGRKTPEELEKLRAKMDQIDILCLMTEEGLAEYIRAGVVWKDMTYTKLKSVFGIPCDRNTYYKYRRKFYWLLDKKKD